MLANHFQNGIETARLVWSRIPNSEESQLLDDAVGILKKNDGGGVESLDYEVIENYAYREEQAQRGKLYVSTGLAAVLINIAVENFAGWKFSVTFEIIQKSYIAGFVVYVLINLVLVYSSVYIITQFAPAAAGSGIPEIKGYLNGEINSSRIFGSIGSVGGGLALGKEGPLVHTGACIASLLGQGGSTKYHLNSRWFQVFKSDRDRRDLVTCGCAAGVAAAFRAPVGGVLWRSQLMWRVFFTSAVVAVVVRTAMGWCKSGKCGHFGSGGFIIWDISELRSDLSPFSLYLFSSFLFLTGFIFSGQEDYSFAELLPMAIIGVIGGLLGALFNQLTLYITTWRRNHLHKKGNRVKIIEACLVSILTSAISFGLPLLRKCSPCPDSDPTSGIECPRPPGMYGNYVNFFCSKDKEYNDLATIFFNTQVLNELDDAIRNLFSAKTINEYSSQSLLTFLVMFYALAVVTFGTAVPAGQFVPGIMIGSTYGRLVGMFVVKYYRKLNIEEGTYALLGAASFLGGSMRMTVSLCVIMVEITNNLKFLPLIMLVLLISKAVGDAFNEGIYEEQAQLRGIPLLESRPKYEMRNMTAKEACGSGRVVSFPRIVKVSDVVSILRSNKHNGFPVIEHTRSGEPLVIGLVLRSHLLVILQSKVDFQHSPLPSDPRGGGRSIRHDSGEFAKPVSSKGICIDDIHLSSDDLEMYIDLAPYLNPSPYIVPEDMSLTKVYNLFRQLGLRHLFVVPRPSRVLGLITRKDLLIEDNENVNTLELQSTSVRIRHQNKRLTTRNIDVERPLLNGLLQDIPD
ncbi:Chloride channel protein CLC-d, partial [Mucuna pruriens]